MNTSAHTAYERRTAAKTLVLCVHGILGSPLQFEWLVKSLPSDVDYKCILLPGHGTTIQNFRKTGAAEWVEYTNRACMDAKEKYVSLTLIERGKPLLAIGMSDGMEKMVGL